MYAARKEVGFWVSEEAEPARSKWTIDRVDMAPVLGLALVIFFAAVLIFSMRMWYIPVAVIAGIAVLGLAAGTYLRMDRRAATRVSIRHDEMKRRWAATNRIRRTDFPLFGPGLETRPLADDLVNAAADLRCSRAWAEAWVGPEWHPELDREIWDMLARLRDSVAQRRLLAESANRDSAADITTATATQIARLDSQARQLAEQVRRLTTLAAELDHKLADHDKTRSDRALRAQLAAPQLGVPTDFDVPTDDSGRMDFTTSSSETAGDLRLLEAQLAALVRSRGWPANPT